LSATTSAIKDGHSLFFDITVEKRKPGMRKPWPWKFKLIQPNCSLHRRMLPLVPMLARALSVVAEAPTLDFTGAEGPDIESMVAAKLYSSKA
jgi:hypothetical protein